MTEKNEVKLDCIVLLLLFQGGRGICQLPPEEGPCYDALAVLRYDALAPVMMHWLRERSAPSQDTGPKYRRSFK